MVTFRDYPETVWFGMARESCSFLLNNNKIYSQIIEDGEYRVALPGDANAMGPLKMPGTLVARDDKCVYFRTPYNKIMEKLFDTSQIKYIFFTTKNGFGEILIESNINGERIGWVGLSHVGDGSITVVRDIKDFPNEI